MFHVLSALDLIHGALRSGDDGAKVGLPAGTQIKDFTQVQFGSSNNLILATLKGSGLAEAVTAALNHTFEDGTYEQVLERWGLQAEAIEKSETNPPGLPKTS